MDKEAKVRIEKAIANSRSRGNDRLAEALVESLEIDQAMSIKEKAA